MKFTFLGTSAGESYPAIFCECENCTYARTHGGKNLRVNTGSMIDDDVLLDALTGRAAVTGRLPFDLPRSQAAVAASRDAPPSPSRSGKKICMFVEVASTSR